MAIFIAIFFAAIGLGVARYLLRDLTFYHRNGWNFSEDSGVPDFWARIGPWRHILNPKHRIFIGYPIFLIFVTGVVVLILVARIPEEGIT